MYILGLAAFAETLLWIDRFYAHNAHQTPYTLDVDVIAVGIQIVREALLSCRRVVCIMCIHNPHHFQIFGTLAPLLIIEAAAVELHQLAESVSTKACGALKF